VTAVWIALAAVAAVVPFVVWAQWANLRDRRDRQSGFGGFDLATAAQAGRRGTPAPLPVDAQEADTIILPLIVAPALPAYVMRALYPYRSVGEWEQAARAACGLAIEAA